MRSRIERAARRPAAGRRRWAISLAEAVVCTVLVGGLLVAALNAAGGIRRTQSDSQQRLRAHLLAQELLSEILAQHYLEPSIGESFELDDLGRNLYALGRDSGESAANRLAFDDVDDYHGWSRTPPQQRDGTAIAGADGLTRSVAVSWVDPNSRAPRTLLETGLKRITVSVTRDGVGLAQLVAYKSVGLLGEQPIRVVLVIRKPLLGGLLGLLQPHPQDTAREDLLESWGYTVTVMDDDASQSAFNSAFLEHHAVYVSAQVDAGILGTKLRHAPVGVVNDCRGLVDELGFAPQTQGDERKEIDIIDNTHAITSALAAGGLEVFGSNQPVFALYGSYAAGLRVLARTNISGGVGEQPSLAVLEYGASLSGGGTAAGRRVQMPWGQPGVPITNLTTSGRALLKRAIEWAGGIESP